jgi:CrcB protein
MIGGAAGALARAGLAEALHMPWATFVANVAGTALLAWLVSRDISRDLLGTGFCGALTTFSTFQIEAIELARDSVVLAVAYALGSIAAGVAVARLFR